MENKKIILIIAIVFSLVVLPLMKPWYIFSLDQVLNPNWWWPTIWANIYWVWILAQVFNFFSIPIWVMEKFLILITFIMPTIWWYLLLENIKNKYSILFWVFILMFNPFLYSRFLDGQINVYLSYAFYPLFFYFLINTYKSFRYKNMFILWGLSLLLCLTSIHNAIFLFFIFFIFSILYFKEIWMRNILTICIVVWVFNLTWILPFFLITEANKISLATQIENFDERHFLAFQTLSSDKNIYINTLSMQWYWWEWENRFISNTQINAKWLNLFLMMFCMVIIWFIFQLKNDKKNINLHLSFLSLFLISYIFTLWISNNNLFSSINQFMYDYFPLYSWFREPHKWVIFMILFYAYYWTYWIAFLIDNINKIKFLDNYVKYIIIFLFITLPILYTPKVLFWFWWQVVISDYPNEWKEIKEFIKNNYNNDYLDCDYKIKEQSIWCYQAISFPWHQYMWFWFTKKIIWWWVIWYFWEDILFWDNIEIRDIYSSSNRPESKIIEKYVWPLWIYKWDYNNSDMSNFINDLKWLWINRIILLKEVDYRLYDDFLIQLEQNKFIELEKSNSMVKLFKIIK